MAINTDDTRLNLGAKKFVVWLFVVASIMIFASLTSGYIVKKGGGNWLHFSLPPIFVWNTLVVLISSLTLHLGYKAAKGLQIIKERSFLWITFALGLVFLVGQFMAFQFLVKTGVFFSGNPSGTFVYVFVLFHGVHILAGLGLIYSAIRGTSLKVPQVLNVFRVERAAIFWHFLDIVWIYLYVFLLLNQ